MSLPVSVLIPTLNEARNLPDCLASVAFAAERIVFDSGSTDATLDIARAAEAVVHQRPFDTFAAHKNWALDHIDFANDWILIVDADERVTPELAAEIGQAIDGRAEPADAVGFHIPRQNVFQGRWVRHAGMYPDYQLRLLRRGKARYEDRIVHEFMRADGPVGFLKNPLRHEDFKGIERYIARHNTYSSLEAVELLRLSQGRGERQLEGRFFGTTPQRRRALKNFAHRYLPARPLLLFLYMYLLRLGFLDGRVGFRYCVLRAVYEYQIVLKLRELQDPSSPLYETYRDAIER